jgi:hypothetical protein
MKQKNWFFEKINKIGKLVIKQTKKKKKRTLIKSEMERGTLQQTSMEFRRSKEDIFKTSTPENWKIKK